MDTVSGERVLIVEDDEALLNERCQVLRQAGFETIAAGTLIDALTIAGLVRPGLIVLAGRDPALVNVDTCRQLSATKNGKIPLLLILGSTSVERPAHLIITEELAEAADLHLQDPVAPLTLIAAISALLRARHAELALARVQTGLEERIEQRVTDLRQANEDLEREIGEIRQIDETVRHAEERFRAAFTCSMIGMALSDLEGRLVQVNSAYCSITGYSEQELLALNFAAITHPDDLASNLQLVGELMAGRAPSFSIEKRYIRKDGEEIWVNNSISLLPDKSGKPAHMMALVENITARKQAEERLQQQLDLTSTITVNLAEGVYAINDRGEVTFMNPAAEQMLGWKQAEMIGRKAHETIHFQKADGTPVLARDCPLLSVLKSGSRVRTEDDVFTRRDGTTFPIAYASTPIITKRGVTGAVLSFRDITEQRRSQRALKQSEEHYRQFFEQDLIGVAVSNAVGQVIDCNPAFARIFGFDSVAEALAWKTGTLFSSRGGRRTFLRRLRRDRKIGHIEGEVRRRDGKPIHVIASVIGVFDEQDHLVQIRSHFIDNSEHKKLEEQFRQAQKMEAIGQLAGGVAHDFNNLLTAINGYSDLVIESNELHPNLRQHVEEIRQAGERAAGLTRQLLAFSRKQVLRPKILDLNGIVTGIEKMLRRLIGEDVNLIINLAPDLGQVRVDPGQIEQVIMNLGVNARDAMTNGGRLIIETANIEIDASTAEAYRLSGAGSYVLMSVSDTGCGMTDEVKSHIFEPFYTTKGQGRGTGLGLSTVYGIVKQSDGYIGLYSEPGHGTSFKVYLPMVNQTTRTAEADSVRTEMPGGDETILLVEDETVVRQLASRVLAQLGYEVLEAADGKEALQVAEHHPGPIHLLLSDVVMPQMNGPELADQLLVFRPRLNVLFMSGYPGKAMDWVDRTEDLSALLQKPFSLHDLARKVRSALISSNIPSSRAVGS